MKKFLLDHQIDNVKRILIFCICVVGTMFICSVGPFYNYNIIALAQDGYSEAKHDKKNIEQELYIRNLENKKGNNAVLEEKLEKLNSFIIEQEKRSDKILSCIYVLSFALALAVPILMIVGYLLYNFEEYLYRKWRKRYPFEE